jgi:alpha-tubulin suppressor-like RCC1 family protein
MPVVNRPVMLGCFSPQDDATVKCWGLNMNGQLGVGDTTDRGAVVELQDL